MALIDQLRLQVTAYRTKKKAEKDAYAKKLLQEYQNELLALVRSQAMLGITGLSVQEFRKAYPRINREEAFILFHAFSEANDIPLSQSTSDNLHLIWE